MSEFIGSRISLVSKSDIRYVGTLHEIDSVSSTVALENVTSFGTEGRKGKPDEEIPPSDQVYEYIVFRGSDVKDLRIEEAPAVKENKPPQPPNDPAILGAGRPGPPQTQGQGQRPNQQGGPQHQGPTQQFQQQYPPPFYPPPPGQWGRGGPMPPGYSMPPYGAPPSWMPPQGFPQGQFPGYGPYGGFPPGPPGQGPPGQGPPGPQQQQQQKSAPIGPGGSKSQASAGPSQKSEEPKMASFTAAQTAAASATSATSNTADGQQPQSGPSAAQEAATVASKTGPSAQKTGRVMPAVPLATPNATKGSSQADAANALKTQQSSTAATRSAVEDATAAATAAVAAAMASLPPAGGQQNGGNPMDNLTKKFSEMRAGASDTIRAPRQPSGTAGFGGRGRGRGGARHETRKVDVPESDFDFESSNAKFNKDDLVKEAIAGSPIGEFPDETVESDAKPAASYNKKSSFFDDLSSEQKDRAESSGSRPGGREWRGEETKKNLETFGQGSVDNGFRGGYRGRGRGRGGRGRGASAGNGMPRSGGFRGGRNETTA